MNQPDLFAPPPFDIHAMHEAQARGWEQRLLTDMETAPVVACYPGFMGAMCERLVEKGLVVREDAGFLEPQDPTGMLMNGKVCTPAMARRWLADYWRDPFPQFRYSLA